MHFCTLICWPKYVTLRVYAIQFRLTPKGKLGISKGSKVNFGCICLRPDCECRFRQDQTGVVQDMTTSKKQGDLTLWASISINAVSTSTATITPAPTPTPSLLKHKNDKSNFGGNVK